MDGTEATRPLLQMRDIVVAFGGVRVIDRAGLKVRSGEIHALLGENGAGKSSLVKVLFGLYQKDEGEISLRGAPARIGSPEEALDRGVAMIHQELPFALHLSTAENIFLGRELRKGPLGLIDKAQQREEAVALLEPFPIEIDVGRPMSTLSVAEQQIVAIAKALSTGAHLIILDEATTALTGSETERLFELLQDLKQEGKTFILITHKLDEVFAIADRMTVLRDGQTVAAAPVREMTQKEVAGHMVGREVGDIFPERPSAAHTDTEKLRVEGLSTRKLKEVSFSAYRGEVLGIAGLMGAGRTTLFNALFGAIPTREGQLFIDGEPVTIDGPAEAIRHHMAYVTEDRKGSGLAMNLGVKENITLAKVPAHTRFGWVDDRALRRINRRYQEKLNVDARTADTVSQLSGGNQQKVVLAKWLATGADIFLMDEPTRGIDVGAKRDVYDLIGQLTGEGKTVLLATSELPELMALSDRFLVFSEGQLVRELSGEEATPEEVIYYASKKPETLQPAAGGPAAVAANGHA